MIRSSSQTEPFRRDSTIHLDISSPPKKKQRIQCKPHQTQAKPTRTHLGVTNPPPRRVKSQVQHSDRCGSFWSRTRGATGDVVAWLFFGEGGWVRLGGWFSFFFLRLLKACLVLVCSRLQVIIVLFAFLRSVCLVIILFGFCFSFAAPRSFYELCEWDENDHHQNVC